MTEYIFSDIRIVVGMIIYLYVFVIVLLVRKNFFTALFWIFYFMKEILLALEDDLIN